MTASRISVGLVEARLVMDRGGRIEEALRAALTVMDGMRTPQEVEAAAVPEAGTPAPPVFVGTGGARVDDGCPVAELVAEADEAAALDAAP